MNVLHVYKTYFPDTQGGLEEVIRQICVNTKPLGINSRVFVLSRHAKPGFISMPEADVYRYKQSIEIASCGFSVDAMMAFKQHVEWADIIHYYFPWPFADVLHFTAGPKKPVILTYVSDIVRQKSLLKLYKPLMRKFLQAADRIVVTSPNHQSNSPTLVDYQDKTTVIPIGLSRSSYPLPNKSLEQAIKDKYGEGFFLFVGVFRYYKGLQYLIEAAVNQSFKVVIAGTGKPEEVAALKKQAADLQANNVYFVGSISDQEKVAMLELSKAIVLPSIHASEAFGVTLLEGAMHGKPLISTELGTGTTYVNIHNETGLVVESKNVLQLREAMNVLHGNQDLAISLGKGALQRYEAIFTGTKMAAAYANEYIALKRQ